MNHCQINRSKMRVTSPIPAVATGRSAAPVAGREAEFDDRAVGGVDARVDAVVGFGEDDELGAGEGGAVVEDDGGKGGTGACELGGRTTTDVDEDEVVVGLAVVLGLLEVVLEGFGMLDELLEAG
jgi:hypothetical protein